MDMTQEEVHALYASIVAEHRSYPCIWPSGCDQVIEYQDNTYCPEHMVAVRAMYDAPFVGAGLEAPTRGRKAADMSPEAVEARKVAKAREVEAIAWVAAYTGSWGLPLDIRASERWGTKYMHLSEKQVDALIAGKARDAARAAEAATLVDDPLVLWLKGLTGHMGGFLASLQEQAQRGRTLSPRQREVAQRIMDEQTVRPEAPSGPVQPAAPVSEGMYRDPQTDTIWKVVVAVHGSGRLYAQRLVAGTKTVGDLAIPEGHFEYDGGAIRRINPAWRLSLEEAKTLGSLYGFCVRCGATLTDDVSIKAGIGPICAKRF
jgi:hypothetical protein